MSQPSEPNATPLVLIGIEEEAGALSEGWRLFLWEIRHLAADVRRRRAEAARQSTTPADAGQAGAAS
jgi:hypothetical protein